MNKLFLAAAALIALNGRFGFGDGPIVYVAVALGVLCLVGAILSSSWSKKRGVIAAPWKPMSTTRLMLLLTLSIVLSHAIYQWSYPHLATSERLAIDLFAFGTALLTFTTVLAIRKRRANSPI